MKKIVLVIAVMIIGLSALCAESSRLAYIYADRIMTESKDAQEAQQLFQADQAVWEKEVQELDAEIERLQNEYETRKLTLAEAGKKEQENKIQKKIQDRQNIVQEILGENGKAAQRNAELLEPIMKKVNKAIEQVAIDNNFDMIIDASAGGLLYAKPALDVTDLVLEELNTME